ncbi:MAG TPA: ABC transporter substrate-binding protein [Candidatus Binatia bacterium]|jgi:ABC-type nitrate/sulfonate/bicarbonate transport system substrate-binding protein
MLAKKIVSVVTKSLGLLALTLIITHGRAVVGAAETLKLGFSGASATQLAGYLAVEQKLFDIYGVNVELTQSAGITMIRALDSGSLHVAIVGGGQALNAYLKGVEVRIISGLINTVPFQLWAKPELSQLKDLKGKLIANTPPGTSLNLANHILLMRAGLHPLKDVKLIAFGRLQLVSQALFSGVVDAALLSAPEAVEARRAGLHMLMDMATSHIPCPFTSVVTSRAVLERSPASLDRFLRGILHGIKLALTNPDMAKKTLSRSMRLTDPEAVEETYRRAVAIYERLPVVPREAIETVTKLSAERSDRNPFGVLDMNLLERIDKEGFVKALYAAK